MRKAPEWLPEEDKAIIEIVTQLKVNNADSKMKEIFPLTAELYNERFEVKRTEISLANRYYWLVREKKHEELTDIQPIVRNYNMRNMYRKPQQAVETPVVEADTINILESAAKHEVKVNKVPLTEASELLSFISEFVGNYEQLKNDNQFLREENNRLSQLLGNGARDYDKIHAELAQAKADYEALLKVINVARQLVVEEEVPLTNEHRKFRMERNGNLITA